MAETAERTIRFYKLFEEMVSAMVLGGKETYYSQIESKFSELAALLNLTRGIVRFYTSPIDEQHDKGETITGFDTGKPGKLIHTVRFEQDLMSIAKMTVHRAEDQPDLNDEEFEKLDLVMRTALAFLCRNRIQETVKQLAFFDDQGFRNVKYFFRYLAWHGNAGDFDGMAAVNYNLRHFSLVNDVYGRDAGDRVLKNHYKHIEQLIGGSGMAIRLGGDSFVCILPQDKLNEMIEYLSHANVVYNDEGCTTSVTCCAGIFVIPEGLTVNGPNAIMGKIMYACRLAQTGGHDHIIFYNEALIEGRERAMRICQKFPEALQKKEFAVFFQPKVNTVTGEICGAEALCRWIKDSGIVQPMSFIPILEQTSDICRLDMYVLDMVCTYIRRWLDEGRRVVRVSVNFSRKHMANDNLLEDILRIVDRHEVPHKYLEIEFTETTTEVEFRALQWIVRALQDNRICTSVDDFGMGYSSLNLIRVIPWNVLKVDRSFLPRDDEPENSVSNIMFRNVVNMAREMGLETIVEGVETPAQLCILRNNKCDLAQGYLFDKPLPVDEFEDRLDMRKYDIGKYR